MIFLLRVATVRYQRVEVRVGLAEVESVSVVVLDFACVLADDEPAFPEDDRAPYWEGDDHKPHIKRHYPVHLGQAQIVARMEFPFLHLQTPWE